MEQMNESVSVDLTSMWNGTSTSLFVRVATVHAVVSTRQLQVVSSHISSTIDFLNDGHGPRKFGDQVPPFATVEFCLIFGG